MLFPSGKFATFDCGFDTNVRQTLEVAGTKASLRLNDFVLCKSETDSEILIDTTAFYPPPTCPEHKVTKLDGGGCCQEANMVEKMCQIVASGQLEVYWPSISKRTQKVMNAIMESAEAGKLVSL